MVPIFIQFLISAGVIVISGTFLVKSADEIAEATKLGRLLVGSLFLAGATSLPELMVDISAVRNHMPDLAIGDLFGSSLLNLFILAIGDLMHRGGSKAFTREAGAHAMSAAMSITITAMAGISIFLGPRLIDYSVGRIGVGSIAIVVVYFFCVRMVYFDQQTAMSKTDKTTVKNPEKVSLSKALVKYLISAGFIVFAAPYLAESAGKIAEITGLGKTFIGTTLVAVCTSLPELVSTIAAIRMGAFELAIGNIFGSNAFNMLIMVPLDFFNKGPILASVSTMHVFTSLATILISSIVVMGQLYQVEKRKRFIEPDAWLVIVLVILSLFILFIFRDVPAAHP